MTTVVRKRLVFRKQFPLFEVWPLVLAALMALAWLAVTHAAHLSPIVIATIPVGDSPHGVGVNPWTDRIYVGSHLDNTVSVIDSP